MVEGANEDATSICPSGLRSKNCDKTYSAAVASSISASIDGGTERKGDDMPRTQGEERVEVGGDEVDDDEEDVEKDDWVDAEEEEEEEEEKRTADAEAATEVKEASVFKVAVTGRTVCKSYSE